MVINTKIKLIEIIKEISDMYTFIFELPKNVSWISGQYAIFYFDDLNVNDKKDKFKVFSISSSIKESKIMFSTRINPNCSKFKTKLLSMKKSDKISIKIPFGNFNITENENEIIGITQGIGITPFRAIIYDLFNDDNLKNISFNLIYYDELNNYLYYDELKKFSKSENINIIFISDLKLYDETIKKYSLLHKNNASYFISGSPLIIKDVKNKLNNIEKNKIKYDTFYGY
jgi:ferredoxin-NADP reductase